MAGKELVAQVEELTRRMDELSEENRRLRDKLEYVVDLVSPSSFPTHDLVRMDLTGGKGGRAGDTQYVVPNGARVTTTRPTYDNKTFHWIEHLFNGTQTQKYGDYWLVEGHDCNLTIDLPCPIHLAMIRLHTYSIKKDRGIESFTVNLEFADGSRPPALEFDDLDRGVWVEIPLLMGRAVSAIEFEFATSTKYLNVNSIELLLNPSAVSNLAAHFQFLLRGTPVAVETPVGDLSSSSDIKRYTGSGPPPPYNPYA